MTRTLLGLALATCACTAPPVAPREERPAITLERDGHVPDLASLEHLVAALECELTAPGGPRRILARVSYPAVTAIVIVDDGERAELRRYDGVCYQRGDLAPPDMRWLASRFDAPAAGKTPARLSGERDKHRGRRYEVALDLDRALRRLRVIDAAAWDAVLVRLRRAPVTSDWVYPAPTRALPGFRVIYADPTADAIGIREVGWRVLVRSVAPRPGRDAVVAWHEVTADGRRGARCSPPAPRPAVDAGSGWRLEAHASAVGARLVRVHAREDRVAPTDLVARRVVVRCPLPGGAWVVHASDGDPRVAWRAYRVDPATGARRRLSADDLTDLPAEVSVPTINADDGAVAYLEAARCYWGLGWPPRGERTRCAVGYRDLLTWTWTPVLPLRGLHFDHAYLGTRGGDLSVSGRHIHVLHAGRVLRFDRPRDGALPRRR